MAKSIRSKRMRKLRAFKRIRYGEKELARLKEMLAKAADEEKSNVQESDSSKGIVSAPMEIDPKTNASKTEKKSKYPSWLSHFKIKKLAKQERKQKRKEMKRLKKEKKVSRNNKSKKSK